MEESEKQGWSRDRSGPVLPEELIVWEILLRLPAKDLFRYRAVCSAWRRHTSAADFLLAHYRRRPSLPLVSLQGETKVSAAFDTLDLRRRPTTQRQPVLRFNDSSNRDRFVLHASCDGLILLSLSSSRFYLCNPATRQWIPLPRLHDATNSPRVAGMYSHSPTGEYRVLYSISLLRTFPFYLTAAYYVLTISSSARPRCIGRPIASPSVRIWVEKGLLSPFHNLGPPVFLHGCLYWIRLWEHLVKGIVVFDTVSESFREMGLPTDACELPNDSGFWHLLEIDGTLGISWGSENETMLKLWVLQDYETEAWSLRYKIEFSMAEISRIVGDPNPKFRGMVVSKDGDALIHCLRSSQLFHLDSGGKLLQTLQWGGVSAWRTGFQFKENLLRHVFLEGSRVGIPSEEDPQFFIGL